MTFRLSPSTSLATGDVSLGPIVAVGSPPAQVVNSDSLLCSPSPTPCLKPGRRCPVSGRALQVKRRDGNRGLPKVLGRVNVYRPGPKQHFATAAKWPLDGVEARWGRAEDGKQIATAGTEMMRLSALLVCTALLATACSTPRNSSFARFDEQEQANLIVRYYTDDTSYLLKPANDRRRVPNGPKKDAILNLAKQQPGRDWQL